MASFPASSSSASSSGASHAARPPVGAPVPAERLRATRSERLLAGVLALACAALLGVAASLDPSPTGVGTHQALGLNPCGWMINFSTPCPSCGMTTAFSYAAHGSLWASVRVQPMGALLAVGTAATLVVSLFVAATGSRIGHALGARLTPRILLILACVALASWGYKIAMMRGTLPPLTPS